jgi:hypothetical protein
VTDRATNVGKTPVAAGLADELIEHDARQVVGQRPQTAFALRYNTFGLLALGVVAGAEPLLGFREPGEQLGVLRKKPVAGKVVCLLEVCSISQLLLTEPITMPLSSATSTTTAT